MTLEFKINAFKLTCSNNIFLIVSNDLTGKLLLCVIHSSRERYIGGKFLALSTLSVFATTPRVKKLFYHEICLLGYLLLLAFGFTSLARDGVSFSEVRFNFQVSFRSFFCLGVLLFE